MLGNIDQFSIFPSILDEIALTRSTVPASLDLVPVIPHGGVRAIVYPAS